MDVGRTEQTVQTKGHCTESRWKPINLRRNGFRSWNRIFELLHARMHGHSLNSDFKSCSESGLGVFERHRAQSSLITLPKRWPIIAAHHSGTRKLSVWISGRRRTAPFDHFRLLPEITERPVSVHKINYAKRNERFNRVYRGNCAWPECHSCLDRLFTQITCGYVVITALLLFFQVFSTFGIEL